jgi:hypothetical protein
VIFFCQTFQKICQFLLQTVHHVAHHLAEFMFHVYTLILKVIPGRAKSSMVAKFMAGVVMQTVRLHTHRIKIPANREKHQTSRLIYMGDISITLVVAERSFP